MSSQPWPLAYRKKTKIESIGWILGRLALAGIWTQWQLDTVRTSQEETEDFEQKNDRLFQNLKLLIINNPTLFTPAKDDQAIDISLAIFSYQTMGLWPLFLVASRHYRLPVPLDFTLEYRKSKENQEIKTNQVDSPKD